MQGGSAITHQIPFHIYLPSPPSPSTCLFQIIPSTIATLRHTPDLVRPRVIRPRHSLREVHRILKYAAVVILNKRILQRIPHPLVPDYLATHDHPKLREYQLQTLISRHRASGSLSSVIRRESDGRWTGEEDDLLGPGGSGNRSSIQIQSYYLTIKKKKRIKNNNMPDPWTVFPPDQ